jgi:amino acid adenylation domain-containing protein
MSVAREFSFLAGHPADTLDEFVLAPAAVVADKPAIVERSAAGDIDKVSYRQLEHRVHEYATALAGLGVGVGDRVIIEAHTCSTAIAMLLACSRLGAAFIPVDPDTPDLRTGSIIEMTEPVLHVRAAGLAHREPHPATPTAWFGLDGITTDHVPPVRPRPRRAVVGTDPAYIIFTSGTTGRPKGVVMCHHAALAFYRGAQRFGVVSDSDRVATTSPLAFDVSLFDISVTLGSGGTLIVVPREFLTFPRRLLSYLRQTRATVVHAVPSLWRPLLRHEAAGVAELDHLRGILFAGENFPLAELRHLRGLLPRLRVINAFGATETVACSFSDVPNPLPDDAEGLSIGHGYPGAEILLIDEDGAAVELPGSVGEMYIRCPSLFTGYWNDPAATSGVLVPDPVDPRTGQVVYRSGDLAYRGALGELYFAGRADSMVKIRGNRIELGEIERGLAEHPAVTSAVAVPVPAADGELWLAAFVVIPPDSREIQPAELVELCKQTMPAYMIPRRIHVLDELPRNVNGKADRSALIAMAKADR